MFSLFLRTFILTLLARGAFSSVLPEKKKVQESAASANTREKQKRVISGAKKLTEEQAWQLRQEQDEMNAKDEGINGLQSSPLTPNLECSACEVTAREIHYGIQRRSPFGRFAGSELEMYEVLEEACESLNKYVIGQETFGARLKIFADPDVDDDLKAYEEPEWYSRREKDLYQGATFRLVQRCEELVGRYEDELIGLLRQRAEEAVLRRFMCLTESDVCNDEILKPYREIELRRRQKWKQKNPQRKDQIREKMMREVNDEKTFQRTRNEFETGDPNIDASALQTKGSKGEKADYESSVEGKSSYKDDLS